MVLATYQPRNPDPSKHPDAYNVFEEYLGYYPIWLFDASSADRAWFGSWFSAPTNPQIFYLLESSDAVSYDAVMWCQLIGQKPDSITVDDLAACFESDARYREYVLPGIRKKDLIGDADMREVIYDYERLGFTGPGAQPFTKLCKMAQKDIANFKSPNSDPRWADVMVKTSFETYLLRPFWDTLMGRKVKVDHFTPAEPLKDSAQAQLLYQAADVLRKKISDTDGLGSYEDFDLMATCLQYMMTGNYDYSIRLWAGDIGRNDPCFCGSGKKFKNCHMGYRESLIAPVGTK